MYFFTADEHYGHYKVIEYCNRPFTSVEQMDSELITRFNAKVSASDITVHIGDFSLLRWKRVQHYIKQLNGNHIFIQGNHDRWLKKSPYKERQIYSLHLGVEPPLRITCCHYAMRVWPASNHQSWQLYGHSHGSLSPIGKQQDVGVDVWNYFPVALHELLELPHLTGG